jgi:hypothetical protein
MNGFYTEATRRASVVHGFTTAEDPKGGACSRDGSRPKCPCGHRALAAQRHVHGHHAGQDAGRETGAVQENVMFATKDLRPREIMARDIDGRSDVQGVRPSIGPAYPARRASGTGNWDQPRHTTCRGWPICENPTYSAFWSVFDVPCLRLQRLASSVGSGRTARWHPGRTCRIPT